MVGLLAVTLLGCLVLWVANTYRKLRRHIERAKETGLPYIVAPWVGIGTFWMIVTDLTVFTLKWIPVAKNWEWVTFIDRTLSWKTLRAAEEKYGDTYLIITPRLSYLKTSNAELGMQIMNRRNDFLKPVAKYKIVDMFGQSILTSEGQEWKRHRKIVGPSFSEKSNKMVFEESLRQAEGMVNLWATQGESTRADLRVENAHDGAAMLSLHVISAAGFGVPQSWPNENEEGKGIPGFSTHRFVGGHTMGLKEALVGLLRNILWFAALSPTFLKLSPFKVHQKTYTYFHECKTYFEELLALKKKQIYLGESEKGTMDLMGPMIKASTEAPLDFKIPGSSPSSSLTKEEIIGNSFIFLFAGHETSANSIHFSMIYLAAYPHTQRAMQADIDSIIPDDKPISEWSYYADMPRLYNSMVGAVLNEQMRLVPAIPNIPKETEGDQLVSVDGRQFTIPDQMFVHVNVIGTNRNPRYWDRRPSKISGKDHDMDDFVPERWLPTGKDVVEENVGEADGLESTSFETSTSSSLHKPPKGAFVSFSEGPRACPGRRFAQVEITAVLTAIFKRYSVELDVREWASDDEVQRMGEGERRALYERARESAMGKVRRCEQVITLQMSGGEHVPLRFVERGKERFKGLF